MISPSPQRWLKPVPPCLTSSQVTATEGLLTWRQEPAPLTLLMATLPSSPLPSTMRAPHQVLRERGCRAGWGKLTQVTVFSGKDITARAARQAVSHLRAEAPSGSSSAGPGSSASSGTPSCGASPVNFDHPFLSVSTDNSITTFFPSKFSHVLAEMAAAVTQVNVSGAGPCMGHPSGRKGTWLLLSKVSVWSQMVAQHVFTKGFHNAEM